MIGYVTLGTNDLERGSAFYDALSAVLPAGRLMEWPRTVVWGRPDGSAGLCLTQPFDEKPATNGNGVMVALRATSQDHVKRIYDCALANGAVCEGAPGFRAENFYAAYFRDLDGNKLAAFVMEQEP